MYGVVLQRVTYCKQDVSKVYLSYVIVLARAISLHVDCRDPPSKMPTAVYVDSIRWRRNRVERTVSMEEAYGG